MSKKAAGSSISMMVEVNWNAGWKLETNFKKTSSSSLRPKAAPTMSLIAELPSGPQGRTAEPYNYTNRRVMHAQNEENLKGEP